MPTKVRIPDDYELTKDGIVYKDDKGEVLLICRIPVIISAIYYNLEDETEEIAEEIDVRDSLPLTRLPVSSSAEILNV